MMKKMVLGLAAALFILLSNTCSFQEYRSSVTIDVARATNALGITSWKLQLLGTKAMEPMVFDTGLVGTVLTVDDIEPGDWEMTLLGFGKNPQTLQATTWRARKSLYLGGGVNYVNATLTGPLYKVSYYPDSVGGGSNNGGDVPYEDYFAAGVSAEAILPKPLTFSHQDGYSFVGWSTISSTGSGSSFIRNTAYYPYPAPASLGVPVSSFGSTSLYAVWSS